MNPVTESSLIALLWPEHQHLNFGEMRTLAQATLKTISDTSFELTKAKIAQAGVKVVDAEEFYLRDLEFIGEGNLDFHITLWGASAPKVQIGVRADSPLEAQRTAMAWARTSWFRDKRDIGLEKVERPSEQVRA